MANTETFTPESLDEVAALLLAADGQACPVPSGTRLLAQASGTSGPTPIVVDLVRVPELNRLDYHERNGLLIGAAVPLVESLRFSPVQQAYAILADGIRRGASGDERACVTLGECLGAAGPAIDLALPLMCLGASAAIFGPHGWSEMSVEALCVKRRGTTLQPGEFVVDVRLPALPGPSGGAYVHSTPDPTAGDPVGAGAFLVMQDDLQMCCGARLTVWAAGQPLRALDAERFLQGRNLDQEAVSTAGDLTAQLCRLPTLPRSANEQGGALKDVACQAILRALERARPHHASDSGARRKRSAT